MACETEPARPSDEPVMFASGSGLDFTPGIGAGALEFLGQGLLGPQTLLDVIAGEHRRIFQHRLVGEGIGGPIGMGIIGDSWCIWR